MKPTFRKRRDPQSSHLRDLLLAGAIGQHLKLVELDLSADIYRDMRLMSQTKSKKFGLSDIGKTPSSTELLTQETELEEVSLDSPRDLNSIIVHDQNEDTKSTDVKNDSSTN